MTHECRRTREEIIHRRLGYLYAKEFKLSLNCILDPLPQALARRNCRNVVEHHHPLVTDVPKENAL